MNTALTRDAPSFAADAFATAVKMKQRQQPLYDLYARDPSSATIVDSARTSSHDTPAHYPLGSRVSLCEDGAVSIPVGVHKAVGGLGDAPTPGDILCAAIASCLDSTLRVIANRFGIRLKQVEVGVEGSVDVRGTLRAAPGVPVGFQRFDVSVRLKASGIVPSFVLDRLLAGAERSCIVIQTLRAGARVEITRT